MAVRGAKPKPAHLLLIDGTRNATRHGSEQKLRQIAENAVTSFGPLQRPARLKGSALTAWKRYIEPAAWLDGSKEAAAIAFCELWREFSGFPAAFPASKHGQLRAYMSELGLTDERNRGQNDKKQKDEFFD